GATTAAVMALGTASTGTAIASLSGAAAVNATLAALGGGAIAAGGGGMALGSAVLGAATLGVGLLVGGVIFNITGSSISDKADEAWKQMKDAEREINKICIYLDDLKNIAYKYMLSLESVEKAYRNLLSNLIYIVNGCGRTNWNDFTESEKMITENTVLFVGLLYNMCKVKLVLKSDNEKELNKINKVEIDKSMKNANDFLRGQNLLY
ncbi:MAG: hypothetical protein SOV48_07540, partial [Intestinibacter sp.]|nr:hypothetical protein [Intestinibacter sp.]